MELLLVLLIVLVAVAFMRRGGPSWYRSGPRRVVRYEDRPLVDDDITVIEERPVTRRRRVIEDF
ncbi:MAG TPA: hypothetical protein VF244_00395 [Acidimicrobiales bacterium]